MCAGRDISSSPRKDKPQRGPSRAGPAHVFRATLHLDAIQGAATVSRPRFSDAENDSGQPVDAPAEREAGRG
jgi:hypothetical protein